MADGLDDARQAFQAEIAPGATRPRDDSGRFAPVARPETMFEPRPLEGDPLTGDVRDAGDDARLAAIERRIADGRAEEGDEAELRRGVQERSRTRSADGRGRHQPTEAEPGASDDKPQQSDQDAQGSGEGAEPEGGEGDAEGQPEQNAEGRFKVTLDGQPVERFEVTVDGKTEEVTLDEALSGYIKDSTFKTRLNKVNEARQVIEQHAAEVAQWRDVYAMRLQQLDRELGELTPPEPDWDQEFARDPRAAHDKQKAFAAIYGKRQQIAAGMQQAAQEARAEYDRNVQRYAVQQFGEFVGEANLPDEKALQSELSLMRSYARKEGFSEAEAATVYDKRMLHVLRKAALYDQLMSNRPKALIAGKGKTLIPGVASPIGHAARRHIDEAQQRLAKTGRLEDAAHVMARLIR